MNRKHPRRCPRTQTVPVLTGLLVLALLALAAVPGGLLAQPVQESREDQAESVWPLASAHEWYWHRPNASLSAPQIEASLAGIASGWVLRPGANWKGALKGISVTRKGIRLKVLSNGQPAEALVPLKNVKSTRLYYASPQPVGQKWLVVVSLTTDNVTQIYFETEAQARSLIDVVASVAQASGKVLEDTNGYGFLVSDLTPAQAQALGKSRIEGALVTLIAYGGPAESAGLRFLDLITEVDGVKVRNADHLVSILDSAAPGTTLTFACLARAEAAEGAAPAGAWTTKTVVWAKRP